MEKHRTILDRRIARTRQVIYVSFISLIQANISRSTFYTHYQDKYDLLDKTIQEKLSDLRELLADSPFNMDDQSNRELPDPCLRAFFEHIAANQTFYHTMFTKMVSSEFQPKLFKVIRESLYLRISSLEKGQKLLVPLDILLDYSSSSILGITKVWVENNMIYTPHFMALQLTRLVMNSFYKQQEMSMKG